MRFLLTLSAVGLLFSACGDDGGGAGQAGDTGLVSIGPEIEGLGKATFGPTPLEAASKADSVNGVSGPSTSWDSQDAVWTVRNQWADTNTAEAREAGMAWEANSGLSWDRKYSAWVESMARMDAEASSGQTFEMTTPYGKVLPAPALECAETALFLRATFASWYGLPFYVRGAGADGTVYIGHMGFRNADGSRFSGSPNFESNYADHSSRADTWQTSGWPQDSRLRGRRLGGSQDDDQPAIGPDAHAGTYFDELFLNKRTGYFMIYLLSYFGSINLADANNLFNLKPDAILAGDPLVKRYQRTGIGHVYVTKHAERVGSFIEAELVSGSMPRRQPRWESAGSSQSAFTSRYAGGPGENDDGDAYAALGGGLKRWRTPVARSGRWVAIVPTADQANWVNSTDREAIAARTDRFDEILGERSPRERREVLLEQIESAREHLRNYPASCAARKNREEAFRKLYALEAEHFGRDTAGTDAAWRELEDYVFAELEYDLSKTCCWNASTAAMYEIIMQKAVEDTEDHSERSCHEPTVFMSEDDGYEAFRQYAVALGRGSDWVAWSEDEACPQRDTLRDTEAYHHWTDWCEVGEAVLDDSEPVDPVDPDDPTAPTSPWGCSAGMFQMR